MTTTKMILKKKTRTIGTFGTCSFLQPFTIACSCQRLAHNRFNFFVAIRTQGVVKFVSGRVPCQNTLIRPEATTPPMGSRLSPHLEESDSDDSSRSSIGARGIPLSFGTPLSDGDDEQDDSESDEEDSEDDESAASNPDVREDEFLAAKEDEELPIEETTDDMADLDTNDEDELKDILQSLGEERIVPEADELDSSERFIGVMEDREDLITVPKTKRVLSFNTLAALNIEARETKSPKRRKNLKGVPLSSEPSSLLTMFSLGLPAISDTLNMRRDSSPVISSSDEEEEELDRQLGEELTSQGLGAEEERNKTPVPLLTPPGSPLTIEVDGDKTTVCEWPSNLTVDSAMTAASELRPMSPASLEVLERKELELRWPAEASTLTPLLRGIYVGIH